MRRLLLGGVVFCGALAFALAVAWVSREREFLEDSWGGWS